MMKLGEVARVSRGLVTGNSKLFVMSREKARRRGLDRFVRPVIAGAREIRATTEVRDSSDRLVVLLATPRDVETYPALRDYLGDTIPRIGTSGTAPIVATYVGVPHFAANPDGLVVLNSLYRVNPRTTLSPGEIGDLVAKLNVAAAKWPTSRLTSRRSPAEFEALEL